VKTFGQTLEASGGIGKGFDFLRITLAAVVVLNHSFLTVLGSYDYFEANHLWPIFGSAVPVFFALSGFLITGSAQRLRLKDFLINRCIRIFPPLAVNSFVCALIIGPLATTLPMHDYIFENREFSHFFLNVIGFIHYQLPGVFTANPLPRQVNGSLWTIPYEIGCYAIMAAMVLLGVLRSGRLMAAFCLSLSLYVYMAGPFAGLQPSLLSGTSLGNYVAGFLAERGNYLYLYFLAGCTVYIFRYSIPSSSALAILAVAIIALGGFHVFDAAKHFVLALPIAYLTAYLGLLSIPKLPLYSRGDYSYGVYLYSYPLQQMLILMYPGMGVATHFLGSMVLATCVAMVSWHFIEKPILSFRKKFSFTARKGDLAPAPMPA